MKTVMHDFVLLKGLRTDACDESANVESLKTKQAEGVEEPSPSRQMLDVRAYQSSDLVSVPFSNTKSCMTVFQVCFSLFAQGASAACRRAATRSAAKQ